MYRAALKDISNRSIPISKKASGQKRISKQDDCKEIASPICFGLFDLGINQDLNQRATYNLVSVY
jgi:hypothetical protein